MSQSCKGLTRPNNIHFKMTGIVRRFSRRRNMSWNRTDYCYIIIGTEFKGKYILEQDELFCCAIISSGLKGKTTTTTTTTNVCPFLLLENSRPLSPLHKPQPPLSSLGTWDFLSTYLEIDSLIAIIGLSFFPPPIMFLSTTIHGFTDTLHHTIVSHIALVIT